jgi:hypothetical protein
MARTVALFILAALALTAFPSPAAAQFSQPKVTYKRFDWKVYKSPHFDIYYYTEEEAFLEQMVSFAESAYLKISEDLDHQLSHRVPLIYYKTHPEFEQTNITLQEIPEAVGAFAEPMQKRMVLPIDLAPDQVYALLAHELVHIFEYDILFADKLGRTIRARPPLWIMEGLASFLAEDEDSFDQMVIRDAVVHSIVPRIEQLNVLSFLTYRFGNAVFTFIESRWGMEGIRNFLFEYRKVLLRNNVPKAIKEAFGMDMEDFNREFQNFLRQRYLPYLLNKEEPSAYGREIGFRRPGVFTFGPTVSPGGELIAVLANKKEELDLWVISGSDGEAMKNLTKGFTNKYQYLVAEVFDGQRDLSWSPAGDQVAVFARKENRRILLIKNARTGKNIRTVDMQELALHASPAFSPDGRKVAFSANTEGVYDIYSYDLETGEIVNHTDDIFVDTNPIWSDDGSTILYNRRINAFEKIFTVSAADSSRKTQLTFGESSDVMPSYSRDGSKVYYSSDRGDGIFNLFTLSLADGEERRLTDVMTGVFAPVELDTLGDKDVVVFTAYFQGRYRLYRMEVGPPVEETPMAERDLRPVELEPFRPPLRLTLDEDQKAEYKRRYQVESPSLELGVTSDGTFFGNTALVLSDLLGDHRWVFALSAVSSYAHLDLFYANFSRRTNQIWHVFDHEDFYYFPNANTPTTGEVDRIKQRVSGARWDIQYPFNRYYGIETGIGISDWSVPVFTTVYDPGANGGAGASYVVLNDREWQSVDVGVFFTGDTTRWRRWGPHHGQRYRIGAFYSPEIRGDGTNIDEYRLDYRKYWHVTRNSSFAWWTYGIASNSSDPIFRRNYTTGGLNHIRGYEFRSLVGDRIFHTNFEFRFPLVNHLVFPFAGISDIRGVLFLDVGGASYRGGEWVDPETGLFVYQDPTPAPDTCETGFTDGYNCREKYKFWNSEEGRLENGVAAYGLGFNFRLGFMELNWIFAKRTDFAGREDSWRSAFYIGNKF